jgi:ubiquinone/menaquinone biosynthesis C-methylase UbiE
MISQTSPLSGYEINSAGIAEDQESQSSLVHLPCRVCDKDSSDFLYQKGGWTIVRCRNCGFVYTNPIPTKRGLERFYSSGIKVDWGNKQNVHLMKDFSSRSVKKKFMQMKPIKSPIGRIWVRQARLIRWNKYLPQGGRFLDVGCAQGHLVIAAKSRKKWDCMGVDIQTHKLRHARVLDPDATICSAAVDELGFKDETFDVVTMTHLLEHTFDPCSVLLELSRILRTNGVLVVTVPNVAHPVSRLMGKRWRRVNPPVHLWYFSPQTLERLVEKAGMKTIHMEVLFLRYAVTVFARKG